MPIYDELWGMEGRSAIPGGSAMNSARAANYFLKHRGQEGKVTYFGAIGTDPKGEVLAKEIADAGIAGRFHQEADTPTGTCAVLVKGQDRSLCANLAAACKYSPDHLEQNKEALDKAKIIYTTSFFITSSVDSLMRVAKYATENDIPLGFNLSAVFLLQFELANVLAALEHADYVFANEDETAAFATAQGMPEGCSVSDIAKAIAGYKKVGKRPRIAVCTNGPAPVVVAQGAEEGGEIQVTEYPVPALTEGDIIDTNGAGDAFVGGFLCELYEGKGVADCVKAAIFLSQEVVKRSGCTFPEAI